MSSATNVLKTRPGEKPFRYPTALSAWDLNRANQRERFRWLAHFNGLSVLGPRTWRRTFRQKSPVKSRPGFFFIKNKMWASGNMTAFEYA
jgi:hypothetical protein